MDYLVKKRNLHEFTKIEFSLLVDEIISAKGGEKYQEKLINHFTKVVPHPDGTDLLFWCSDKECNSSTIIRKIERWCNSNNVKGFQE